MWYTKRTLLFSAGYEIVNWQYLCLEIDLTFLIKCSLYLYYIIFVSHQKILIQNMSIAEFDKRFYIVTNHFQALKNVKHLSISYILCYVYFSQMFYVSCSTQISLCVMIQININYENPDQMVVLQLVTTNNILRLLK